MISFKDLKRINMSILFFVDTGVNLWYIQMREALTNTLHHMSRQDTKISSVIYAVPIFGNRDDLMPIYYKNLKERIAKLGQGEEVKIIMDAKAIKYFEDKGWFEELSKVGGENFAVIPVFKNPPEINDSNIIEDSLEKMLEARSDSKHIVDTLHKLIPDQGKPQYASASDVTRFILPNLLADRGKENALCALVDADFVPTTITPETIEMINSKLKNNPNLSILGYNQIWANYPILIHMDDKKMYFPHNASGVETGPHLHIAKKNAEIDTLDKKIAQSGYSLLSYKKVFADFLKRSSEKDTPIIDVRRFVDDLFVGENDWNDKTKGRPMQKTSSVSMDELVKNPPHTIATAIAESGIETPRDNIKLFIKGAWSAYNQLGYHDTQKDNRLTEDEVMTLKTFCRYDFHDHESMDQIDSFAKHEWMFTFENQFKANHDTNEEMRVLFDELSESRKVYLGKQNVTNAENVRLALTNILNYAANTSQDLLGVAPEKIKQIMEDWDKDLKSLKQVDKSLTSGIQSPTSTAKGNSEAETNSKLVNLSNITESHSGSRATALEEYSKGKEEKEQNPSKQVSSNNIDRSPNSMSNNK